MGGFRTGIVTPTYASWDDVPSTASLVSGDILPDGSIVEFASRTTIDTWSDYSASTDTPEFPTTAKDMSNMAKYESGDTLYGTQAKENEWYKSYRKDIDSAPAESTYEKNKVYKDTFK